MELGKKADDSKFVFPLRSRKLTHTHIIGGSRLGKSKLMQLMIEEDIAQGRGVCLIDWAGALYHDVVNNLPYLDPGQKVILIDPSASEWIVGFNPFAQSGKDPAIQVNRRIAATLRPWGDSPNEMPTFQKVAGLLFTFAVEMGETLPVAELLIRRENEKLREWLVGQLPELSDVRSKWMTLNRQKSERDWNTQVMSTENRVVKFLRSKSVRRFFGIKSPVLNLEEEIEQGSVILVNLGLSDYLDREAASVFAPLLINEFFEVAMRKANDKSRENPDMFFLYLDEFQAYINDDLAAMLDQVLKGGVSLVMAHHHTAQEGLSPHLLKSIIVNARNRFVFGGIDIDSALMLADDMFLHEINEYQYDREYTTLLNRITKVRETVYGSGSNISDTSGEFVIPDVHAGTSTGHGDSSSAVESDIPWHDIKQEPNTTHRDVRSIEQKRRNYAAELIGQAAKNCCGRVLDAAKPGLAGTATHFRVFKVSDYFLGEEETDNWVGEANQKAGAIPADQADQQVEDSIKKFIAKTGVKLGPQPEKPKTYTRRKTSSSKSE